MRKERLSLIACSTSSLLAQTTTRDSIETKLLHLPTVVMFAGAENEFRSQLINSTVKILRE